MSDLDLYDDPRWDSRELGASEKYCQVDPTPNINETLDDELGLQLISIRLQKSLIEDLKVIAQLNGMGYQTLARQVLYRFAECEKKQIMREHLSQIEAIKKDEKTKKSVDSSQRNLTRRKKAC
jgi:hypothetical protein